MFIATLILIALALRALYLHAWLSSSTRIRTERKGCLTCEVRRRVGMEKSPNHVSHFQRRVRNESGCFASLA